MSAQDIEFMRLAIEAAGKCRPEDARQHPLVGAVLTRDGKLLDTGFRGERGPGEHAEYTLLEGKLKDTPVSGATLYTTLEPCTTRGHPKVACADRLIERKITRVVIGMLDPNPAISGKGQRRLREANIITEFFTSDRMAEVEDLNRNFIRYQEANAEAIVVTDEFVQKHAARPLDEWYREINRVYWSRNVRRDPSALFTHLVEVFGGLSQLASGKQKTHSDPESFTAKTLAWWMALSGRLGVRSVEDILWDKFPGVCPYCQQRPHNPDVCLEKKGLGLSPDWLALAEVGKSRERPHRLSEWQAMFSQIYPAQQTEDFGPTFARLAEELGELAEAVRVFVDKPNYFLSEAGDVFAWLMHIQNIIDSRRRTSIRDRGKALEVMFCNAYPDRCRNCGDHVCSCPAVLRTTIGRIAHQAPVSGVGASVRFMTPDAAQTFFK